MIKISELKVIEDTFFASSLSYYKPSIYSLIEKNFREENEFSDASIVKLKNLIKGKNDMAFNVLLKEDAQTLQANVDSTPKEFDEALWRDMLPKIRDQVKKTLGLGFKPRSVFFDESFPEGLISFEIKGASSITIFEGNDGAGVCFLNKRVSSLFTPILLIHEQLHSCLSQNKSKDQMYIEWFEEGLCQWYSLKIYYEMTKNLDILRLYQQRAYIYSKIKDEHNFTKRYYEYMKLFARLYLAGGEKLIGKMLIDYMANQREDVNKYLETDNLKMKNLPKDEIDSYLVNFTFCVEPEKLHPLEYLILRELLSPKSLEELLVKIKAPQNVINQALVELNLKGMIVGKNEKIEINWRKKDLFDRKLIMPYWPL